MKFSLETFLYNCAKMILTLLIFIEIENNILSQNDTIINKDYCTKITDIKISGQSIFEGKYPELKQQFEKDKSLTLSSGLKNIEIFWKIIDTLRKEGDSYQFSYILRGNDRDWTISNKFQVNYTDVKPGKYLFEIRCSKNGIWNNAEFNSFVINFLPEFYQTSWFIAICIIVVTLMFLIIIKLDKKIELIINLLFWVSIYSILVIYNLSEKMEVIANNPAITFGFIIKDIFLIPGIFLSLAAHIVNFYMFYFLIFPSFQLQKKYYPLVLITLLSSIIVGYIFRFAWLAQDSNEDIVAYIILTLIFGSMGVATKKLIIWKKTINENKVLFKKLYASKTALLLLQSQLNPHFLFNSLNNIDILVEENPKKASDYLKKLSDILRYVLYETKEDETDVAKEIEQIKSFIELQKIRSDNPYYVNFSIKGELKGQKIAPMIFIPFVENAFKHCKNKSIENAIAIEFEISKGSVTMICKNYYETNQLEIIKNEGLGIETIKQRLNLLYPNNHELVIDKTGNWFNVYLSIQLKNVN